MSDTDEPVETGLTGLSVTAAVTAADPVADPPPARAQVPTVVPVQVPTVMPDGWTLHKVAALVRDVAQAMYDEPYVLKKHGLSEAQYIFLTKNEFFQHALEAETISWQRADNVNRRLALEAAIAVEDALPTVAARLSKTTEPLSDVVALLKVLSEIAGTIGAKAASTQPTGEKFKIVINLGADTVQREATPMVVVEQIPGGAAGENPIRSFLQATGVPKPI